MSNNVGLVPTWEDSESLPQVHAYVLEILRWRPITPIGVYFQSREIARLTLHTVPLRTLSGYVAQYSLDQWLRLSIPQRDQCIPAGAIVIGSHW